MTGERRIDHITHLLEEARAGDQHVFGRLFAEFSSERCLLMIAASLPESLRSKLDPEDILQVVFERAWRNIAALQEANSAGFHRWIAGIARHVVADAIRRFHFEKRHVRREKAFHTASDSGAFACAHTPSQSAARREQAVKIAAILDELKESYRNVIIHRILEGRSTGETAALLKMSSQNVRVTLSRALQKLGSLLEQHGITSSAFRSL